MSKVTAIGQERQVAVHRSGRAVIVGKRKDTDDGWWLAAEHGGLSDFALTSGDWVIASNDDLADLFERVRSREASSDDSR